MPFVSILPGSRVILSPLLDFLSYFDRVHLHYYRQQPLTNSSLLFFLSIQPFYQYQGNYLHMLNNLTVTPLLASVLQL